MDPSSKTNKSKMINLALLLSLLLPLLGSFLGIDADKAAAIGSLAAGLILVIFYREVAEERFRINQETKNKHLKEFFAGETLEGDRVIALIIGTCFLIVGVFLSLAAFA
jgi:hypothetical protein